MRNALEETILVDLFPQAQIDLGIQVLQADGSVLAACINAAMLAVADAGEPYPCFRQLPTSTQERRCPFNGYASLTCRSAVDARKPVSCS